MRIDPKWRLASGAKANGMKGWYSERSEAKKELEISAKMRGRR